MMDGMAGWVSLGLSALPAMQVLSNLPFYRRLPRPSQKLAQELSVSVLIPARNEAARIGPTLEALMASDHAKLEVVVMDDDSEDATASVVRALAERDPRIRLEHAPPLATGWNGKQHACHALAQVARGDVYIFLDADVRLAPDAVTRIAMALDRSQSDLLSGFPRQETGTFLEWLLIPVFHFVLLGFLPLLGMRLSRHPAFGAGCGQLMAVRRESYSDAGGHGAIRTSRHDGLQLPRAFRRADKRTDLFDATDLATCRMYHTNAEVWNGLAKNADEGMASSLLSLLVWTVLLGLGQVLPLPLLALAWIQGGDPLPPLAAFLVGLVTHAILALRFRQSAMGVLLYPLRMLLLLALQWYAWAAGLRGRAIDWKGRQA